MKSIEDTKIWKAVLKAERFIIILTASLCVLTISLEVVLRYLFDADLYGIEEFLVIFAFWLYFIGGAYGSYEGSHIRADILSIYIKNPKLNNLLNIIELSISTFVAVVFTFWGFKYFMWGLQRGASSPGWRIPLVISQSPIFIGFFLMSVYSGFHLSKSIKKYIEQSKKD